MTIESDHLYALIFHHTSTEVMVGLSRSGYVISQASVPYREASKELVTCIDQVLSRQTISLTDLTYLGCNIGPAPFTTLRTIVVTVNGLGYATGKQLIGINGLLCLVRECHAPMYRRTYGLMNAFGNNVYYAVYDPSTPTDIEYGLAYSSDIVNKIAEYSSSNPQAIVQIVGNAAQLCRTYLQNFDDECIHLHTDVTHSSLQGIATSAANLWNEKSSVFELKPYYGVAQ